MSDIFNLDLTDEDGVQVLSGTVRLTKKEEAQELAALLTALADQLPSEIEVSTP